VSIYDLSQLRQKGDKYRSQLSEIYAFFSEGFDTTDLVTAKARLKTARLGDALKAPTTR